MHLSSLAFLSISLVSRFIFPATFHLLGEPICIGSATLCSWKKTNVQSLFDIASLSPTLYFSTALRHSRCCNFIDFHLIISFIFISSEEYLHHFWVSFTHMNSLFLPLLILLPCDDVTPLPVVLTYSPLNLLLVFLLYPLGLYSILIALT